MIAGGLLSQIHLDLRINDLEIVCEPTVIADKRQPDRLLIGPYRVQFAPGALWPALDVPRATSTPHQKLELAAAACA